MYNPPELQYLPLVLVESLVNLRLQLHKTADTLCSQSLDTLLKTNFKLWIMKKITTLLSSNSATKNEQVQETLLVTAILAVIVTVSILFI